MTGHEIGLLKEYMHDLVEQAHQESEALKTAGYQERDYTPEDALMDLMGILDDRMETEGLEVGLSETFRHQMGQTCKNSQQYVKETVWLEANLDRPPTTKAQVRKITYKALLTYIDLKDS